MKKIISAIFLASMLAVGLPAAAQKNPELAESPPMGWNSWNWFGKHRINEQTVKQTIDSMAENGLRDAGYTYVVIDGGWRDRKQSPEGELIPHPGKFPHGIKPLADYAHSRGMKLGLHTVPGTHDCRGDPVGAFSHEEVHLRQFLEWGIDFIKLDLCKMTGDPCDTCQKSRSGWSEKTIRETYTRWSRMLNDCGRDILLSISAYKYRDWYPDYCNMARTTRDIQARINSLLGARFTPPDMVPMLFLSVMEVARINNLAAEAAGHGYWNDPDMMVTGGQGLSEGEEISHFALWCIMSSPLMLGNDPGNMSEFEKQLVMNREMIAINQDPTGQGRLIRDSEQTQVWAKKLKDGNVAVLLLNLDRDGPRDIHLDLEEVGFSGEVPETELREMELRETELRVKDLINHRDLGTIRDSISLRAGTNECWFLLLSNL